MKRYAVILCGLGLAHSHSAHAATIYTGTTTTDGWLYSSDIFGNDSPPSTPAGTQRAFTLEFKGASIADASTNVDYAWYNRIYDADEPTNQITEYDNPAYDGCTLADGCGTLSPAGEVSGIKPFSPLSITVFGSSAVFSFSNPADFDTCGSTGTPGCFGALDHYAALSFGFQVTGNKPVAYRLTMSDPLGTPTAVPEPASWAMLIAGFGLVGGSLRKTRITKRDTNHRVAT